MLAVLKDTGAKNKTAKNDRQLLLIKHRSDYTDLFVVGETVDFSRNIALFALSKKVRLPATIHIASNTITVMAFITCKNRHM